MDLFDVTQVALEKALVGASLRQRILANNLANANTPGYKRFDVEFHGALARQLEATERSKASLAAVELPASRDTQSASRIDGNNVDVDGEMASLAENSLDYQALVAVARARIRMLDNVISGR